jgi:signal peptidase II
MLKKFSIALILFIGLFTLDQYIKSIFVNGFVWHSECISLILAYNKGVAFSIFAFLADNLKYIQLGIMFLGVVFLLFNKNTFADYYIPIALLFAGGLSNIYDRFNNIGVVDYVYWHCWFDFAIFNFADVIIDIAVVLILFISYKKEKLANNS